MRRVTTFLMVAAFAFAFAGSAVAQEYPPEVFGEVAVSDSTVVCGAESVTVDGSGWTPGVEVEIFFDSTKIGSATPDAQGNFQVTVDIPAGDPGEHTLRAVQQAEGDDPVIEGEATITCVAGAGLAVTGANISVLMAIVAGLLVAGGAALFAGRRRKVEAE